MTDVERPRLIVVAGPNGSAKTSVTEQLLRHTWMDGCVYVNPDLIARDEFGDWNSPDAVLSAARRATEIRERCLAERKSLAFETVLSVPDKVEFIGRAKSAGFFIRLFFVCTDDPANTVDNASAKLLIRFSDGHSEKTCGPLPSWAQAITRELAIR